jgi:hypothetical protein
VDSSIVIIFVEINKEKDMTANITTQVQNYQGTNSFINKMKQVITQYGKLTQNQVNAVERIFKSITEVKKVELTGDLKTIFDYSGENSFVKEIKSKLIEFGKLTEKQTIAAMNQITKENKAKQKRVMNIPAPGNTIKVGRAVGERLKEQYNLLFNPILLDITKVLEFTPKAVKFSGKITVQSGSVCKCCGRTLTDDFSKITGVGKTCATYMGITYITDKSQVERFNNDFMKQVDAIGEMEFWVPISQIKVWDGKANALLKMYKTWF